MKVIAVILLVSFASFTCEQVIFSFRCIIKEEPCQEKCAKTTCDKMPEKQDNKETSSPKCMECPMFAVLMHELSNSYSTPVLFAKVKYPRVEINPSTDFSREQWKPPNAFHGFSV